MKTFVKIVLLTVLTFILCLGGVVHADNGEIIRIRTAEDFIAISSNPSGSYRLSNNISLSGYDISSLHQTNFRGILDGNGYSISGINITESARSAAEELINEFKK